MFRAFQYHPAFDIYNCIFRILRILICKEIKEIETNRLRLFDFYLIFPGLIKKIRIRPEHQRAKNSFSEFRNRYNIASVENQARHVFERIIPFQELALDSLKNKDMLNIDKELYVSLNKENLPTKLVIELQKANQKDKELIRFLCDILCDYDLNGLTGLKDRTGLMGFRYDVI